MNQCFKVLRQFFSTRKLKRHGIQEQQLTNQETFDMLQQALPIRAAKVVGAIPLPTDSPDESLMQPLVWLQAQNRPDATDLGRVHQIEKEGKVKLTWIGLDLDRPVGHVLLQCVFVRPVRTSFLVDFPAPLHFFALKLIGKTRHLTLLTGEITEWIRQQERPLSLRDLEILEQSPNHFSLSFDETGIGGLLPLLEIWEL